jgi:hypothetical protein
MSLKHVLHVIIVVCGLMAEEFNHTSFNQILVTAGFGLRKTNLLNVTTI